MQLAGKRIIVTGGASGIGAAVVLAYAQAGAQVVALDLNDDAGAQLVAHCHAQGGPGAAYLHCDVSQAQAVNTAFDAAAARMGGLDVLVHAAAIAPGCAAADISVEQWDQLFAINSRGTLLTNQAAFRHMQAHGGRLINFASAAGVNGYPGKAHYAATKGAVLAWTRSIAREWAPHGITANAIAPGMATPMYAKTRASMTPEQLTAHDAMMAAAIPLGGKLGDPARDLAPVLVFLASEGARFITGQTLPIDGGMLMLT